MRTLQLPLYHFIEDADDDGAISIDRMYVCSVGMFVPYLAVEAGPETSVIDLPFMNDVGRVPYAVSLPEPVAKYGDWRELVMVRRRSKMLWWRRALPDCSIRQQYAAAELHEIRGYTSLKAIESGAVIRELKWKCERIGRT